MQKYEVDDLFDFKRASDKTGKSDKVYYEENVMPWLLFVFVQCNDVFIQ